MVRFQTMEPKVQSLQQLVAAGLANACFAATGFSATGSSAESDSAARHEKLTRDF